MSKQSQSRQTERNRRYSKGALPITINHITRQNKALRGEYVWGGGTIHSVSNPRNRVAAK